MPRPLTKYVLKRVKMRIPLVDLIPATCIMRLGTMLIRNWNRTVAARFKNIVHPLVSVSR